MTLVLILSPILAAGLLWVSRSEAIRRWIVALSVIAVAGLSIALACVSAESLAIDLPVSAHVIGKGMFAVELFIGVFILYVGIRSRHWPIIGLVLAQTALIIWFELQGGAETEVPLFVDRFAVLMALINGLVGGGICLYALGYMRDYHEKAHPEIKDRRPLFFALLFLFMGSMFGLIFANNLSWLLLFWEITTLCSFLLIGYTRTDEAKRNALRALAMNLAGGFAFAIALVWLQHKGEHLELQALIHSGSGAVLLPAALLCFAGITKSAQLPFSSWLLGAMVAPTPVSALLHSSTMVKAGVYLVLRVAPVIAGTRVGLLVALVGSITFVIGALAAITNRDAKKVLAWSTISNLGLIVLCGGIGTAEAVWAGILLILFHAVAKCLLFLCVGVVEHKLRSRDIESMSGLVVTMPKISILMQIGMAGMFLAPFGMLISKWAVLKAVVDASPALSVFIVFGSSATLFFWVKWMGKLLEVVDPPPRVGREMEAGQAAALYGLAAATFLACLLFPIISISFIEPHLLSVYEQSAALDSGNVILMVIMMALVMLFPISFINYGRGVRIAGAYLGGVNVRSRTEFRGASNQIESVATGNYYLHGLFNETSLARWGAIGASVLIGVMLLLAC